MGVIGSVTQNVVKDVAKHNLAQKIPFVGPMLFKSRTSQVAEKFNDLKGNIGMMRNARKEGASFKMASSNILKIAGFKNRGKNRGRAPQPSTDEHRPPPSIGSTLGKNLLIGAGTVGAGVLAAGAITGVQKLMERRKHNESLEYIKKVDPDLMRDKSTMDNFEVLKQYAPDLASNKNVAHSYLTRARQLGMTPHEFVKDLTAIQGTIDRSSVGSGIRDFAMKGIGGR